VEALELDLTCRLRSFALRLALDVAPGTTALVGPSGAGKTTVLRCVAGLHRPDAGRIALGPDVWFGAGRPRAPEHRAVGLVPQDHGLFPHLSVRQNVAFGGAARADELLERFGIAHLATARPGAISGGERQRVALARALARDPGVLLLDEPLSALDADTRGRVRAELQDVLRGLGLPTLLVTHDARDAAALAERVAVLVAGELRQLGTFAELMDAPADAWTARFTGASVLPGVADGDGVRLDTGERVRARDAGAGGRVGVVVHPWEVALGGDGENVVTAPVAGLSPEGAAVRVRLATGLELDVAPGEAPAPGALVRASFPVGATRLVRL
jgi:molybdate transport system ATP-binding protein